MNLIDVKEAVKVEKDILEIFKRFELSTSERLFILKSMEAKIIVIEAYDFMRSKNDND